MNSYGKQFIDRKNWNAEKSKWNNPIFRIGIDIDDTILHTWEPELLDRYNQKHHKNLTINDILTHDFNGDPTLREAWFEYFYENHDNLKIYEHCREVLQKLKNNGHSLYIVTSRPLSLKNQTEKYLEKYFGKDFFEKICYTEEFGDSDDKSDIALKLGLDVIIDDAPHHIERYLGNTKAKTIVFSQSYNKNFSENSRLKIMKNWDEFEGILENFSHSPFRMLLEELNTLEKGDRIRFTSSNPHDMTRDILDAHFELPKMCHYLHFALQSGSDEVLACMNRRHTYEDFKKQVEYLRSKDPLFSISTDIIVGFPGETEEQFQATVRAMRELEFDFAYIARYSSRSGTIATDKFGDDISHEEKARRWNILNSLLQESVQKRAKLMIGRTEEVLISGPGKDETLVGRTRNFKEIFIPFDEKISVGDIVKVKITELDRWVLKGEVVE